MAIRWSYGKREKFADAHGRKCAHCGIEGLVSKKYANGDASITYNIDHIIPETNGGVDDISNLQLLCWPCNGTKNNRSVNDFERHYIVKQDVMKMKNLISESTGLSEIEVNKLTSALNMNDQHYILSKLVSALK